MIVKLKYKEGIYEDAEDSWLLQKVLEKYVIDFRPKTILDVGTGTGILAITAAKLGCKVTSIDIDLRACNLAKSNAELNNVKLNIICSDLLDSIKSNFDLIVFNPPYLPEDEVKTEVDKAIVGGPTGVEVFLRFLERAKSLTNHILFVYSSLEDVKTLMKHISKYFKYKELARQNFEGESLWVGLLTKQ